MTPRRAMQFTDPVTPASPRARGESPRPPSRAYRLGYWLGTYTPGLAWWGLVAVGGPLSLYLLPALLAYRTRHPHRQGILAWNLVLGWTGTGWLAALLYVWWVR